jgi:hypothetical protein
MYCWRLSVTEEVGEARRHGALITGWVILTAWALVVSMDAGHDASVLFARYGHSERLT